MTDDVRLPDPRPAIVGLPPGSAVVFRHYESQDRRALAKELLILCRRRKILLLIAGDRDMALEIGADGIHLPEYLTRRSRGLWNRNARSQWLVTAAAHSRAAIGRAARAGADAAIVSPVFPTASHPGAPSIGPVRFAAWARSSPIPVYALGGVTAQTAQRLAHSGAVGLAGIGGLR